MEKKRVGLYLLILAILCLVTSILTRVFYFSIHEGDLPIPVMVMFTVPAFFCVVSLLSTNGFRNFRLDVLGIVSSAIWVITFVCLIGVLYFMVVNALRYPDYSREYTAVILAICSFIGVLPLIALHDTFKKNAKLFGEQGKRPGKVLRNMQYATLFAATLLILLILLPARKEDGYILMFIEYGAYTSGLVGVILLFGFLSISLSLIFLLAGWLWKQARIASILSVLILVPFIGVLSYAFLQNTFGSFEGSQLAGFYQYDQYESDSSDGEVIYEIVDDSSDSDYDDDGDDYDDGDERYEIGAYHPEMIGDGIIGTDDSDPDVGDLDSISAAVSYFARNMALEGNEYIRFPVILPEGMLPFLEYSNGSYYVGGKGSLAYDGIVKLLWSSRKSMYIKGMFDYYAHLIKEEFPYETYRDNGYELLVNQLIAAYGDMEGKSETFAKIYTIMSREEDEDQSFYDLCKKYYQEIEAYVLPGTHELFLSERGENEDDNYYYSRLEESEQRIVWVYSFWGRRDHEGIAHGVYEALVKLRDYYRE